MGLMENLLTFQGSWKSTNETTPPGIALLQRSAVLMGESLKATAQALSLCKCIQPAHPLALRAQQMALRRGMMAAPI
jgi:hypothetical protein